MLLITGGAGFIGANLVHHCLEHTAQQVVVLDALTYAGGLDNLEPWLGHDRLHFEHGDIRDRERVRELLHQYQPRAIIHLAAESHVDRSIATADAFVDTNVVGTMRLLQATLAWWDGLPATRRQSFRLLHVSTDEVFGSLAPDAAPFDVHTPYAPSNPYAAAKAAADHLVMAWHRTHGLPTCILHSANNYGPRQYPEKLIPLTIQRVLAGATVPVYGDGLQQRDWLHVTDHCRALMDLLEVAEPGEVYLVGGGAPCSNRELLRELCRQLDAAYHAGRIPAPPGGWPAEGAASRLRQVTDRPGHDRRYASSNRRLHQATGWRAQIALTDGLRDTVQWYLDNPQWLARRKSATPPAWLTCSRGQTA